MQDPATNESGPSGKSKCAVVVVIVAVIALYAGYLWWISGVLPVVERFPSGKPQTTGYVKRYGTAYEKTGRWTTFHPNEQKASEGMYEHGKKVPDSWHYWDPNGREISEPAPGDKPARP